jgi:hypothetical protein
MVIFKVDEEDLNYNEEMPKILVVNDRLLKTTMNGFRVL